VPLGGAQEPLDDWSLAFMTQFDHEILPREVRLELLLRKRLPGHVESQDHTRDSAKPRALWVGQHEQVDGRRAMWPIGDCEHRVQNRPGAAHMPPDGGPPVVRCGHLAPDDVALSQRPGVAAPGLALRPEDGAEVALGALLGRR